MDENLMNSFDQAVKSKYATRLYRTCYDMKSDTSENRVNDVKMASCLNLKPKNNFQILENLVEVKEKPKKITELIDCKHKPQLESPKNSIDSKDYKKLLMLKQKLENSFRSKANSKIHKSVFIDFKAPTTTINSSVVNPAKSANSENIRLIHKDGEKINKHLIGNSSGLLNRKYLRKKYQKNQQKKQQEQQLKLLGENKSEQIHLNEFDLSFNKLNATKAIIENNITKTKNSSNSSIHEEGDYNEENGGELEINVDSDELSSNSLNNTNQQTNNYDLECLKSICDTNKVYLQKLYNNFDIPILYCDSENQFNQSTKTDLIEEKEENELDEQEKPFLKMNPIQFNYNNIRQPRSVANQQSRTKKPHWVNVATVGKQTETKKPQKSNNKITSHLVTQKPEQSLIFVSTFSSLSSLSEYLKNKNQNDELNKENLDVHNEDMRKFSKKSLNQIHSDEIYSECHRLKSKSAVVSPNSYYSINNKMSHMDDDAIHKRSFSDISSNQCKLPDLISPPKLYVLNKNNLNVHQQQTLKAKPSFITQTQVYKKLSELQRQNTFEYLKFVSVKNLKETNEEVKIPKDPTPTQSGKFVAPKISKKIMLKDNGNESNNPEVARQKFRNAVMKNLKSIKSHKKSINLKKVDLNKTQDSNYVSSRSSSLSSTHDLDAEMDELKVQNEEEHYEEEEDDDEDREPDFVITQNSKSDHIAETDSSDDLEPRLNKSQTFYTHVLTSSSQLREFYNFANSTNSTRQFNFIFRNSFNNLQFRDAWEFLQNEKQVRKLHHKVVEKLEKQRSVTDIRLINFISSNLNYNNRSNFDCYKFYERSKTSTLLQNLRYKIFDQITMAHRLSREPTFATQTNSEILEKSITIMETNELSNSQ